MKKETKKNLCISTYLLFAFIVWTILVVLIDVQKVGPHESSVGFASMNVFVHKITGVHMTLYNITDWLSVIPFCFIMAFACLGLIQWIKRKKLLKIDYSILVLGCFYIVVMTLYALFEILVVNYRPILIDGCLEASYPSSTTMLVLCVMPTTLLQLNSRIENAVFKKIISFIIIGFTAFMVIARLISGVHWLSDIIGGSLLSSGLVMVYYSACKAKE